ncbi:hypothetical protein ACFUN7_24220 [Streptomyces sp. NPDC057236]|uniref:hypothetical protein n=1 Tax=Streptomyces sp. NPDC057236 TaxID=3346059 RepID=UPI003645464A
MAFPSSGYNVQAVKYFISSSAGASLSIVGEVLTGENDTEMEELVPYLDSALASFKSAYNSGTSYTVSVKKSFQGETTPAAL